MSNKLSVEALIRITNKMFTSDERTNAESVWTLLSEFVLTNQHGLFHGQETKGDKRTRRLYDSTAIQANHDLAATIHSTLTNPATKWARFRFKSEELNNDSDATKWLERANELFHDALASSNFNNEISRAYKMYPSLGSMVLMHEQTEIGVDGLFSGFQFKAWHLAEVAWSENMKGLVDAIYRKFNMTARQAHERWGNKLPEKIIEALEENPEKEFQFFHCIMPRDPDEVELSEVGLAPPDKRPFASVYISSEEKVVVEKGGYYELPTHIVRWETMPGEVYGRGPGHIALPDIRTLNRLTELRLHAVNKSINPPMIAEQRSVMSALDLRPGQVSVVKDINGVKELVTQARLDMTQLTAEELKVSIKGIFFLDKLFLPDRRETGEMTAFEIATRTQQLQQVIGPTLGRLNTELLDPIVKRGFNMMLRGGAFGPLPEALANQEGSIEVEYVNALSRSQKIEDVTAISQWAQQLALLAQINPNALDLLDVDDAGRLMAKRMGVPDSAIADEKEVDEQRQQRAQQQQQEQMLDSGVKAADISSKLNPGGSGV